jgi:flagellar assembly protein FliH
VHGPLIDHDVAALPDVEPERAAHAFAFPTLQPAERPPTVGELSRAIADARSEADAIREQARAAGRAEGLAQARAETAATLEPSARALAEAVQEARGAAGELAERLERDAVELALQLAEKIVVGAIEADPERVLDVVRGGLRGLVDRSQITILVHPDDLPALRDGLEGLRDELGGIERCELLGERRVGRGGALVRTAAGEVDVRIEAKLDRARQLLRETARR